MSPYVGRAFTGKVVRTIVRGTTVFREGTFVSEPVGKLIKPEPGAVGEPSDAQKQETEIKGV